MLLPATALHAELAATTEEVSLIAVPAHIPNPISPMPNKWPNAGKRKTAKILNREIVEILEKSLCYPRV